MNPSSHSVVYSGSPIILKPPALRFSPFFPVLVLRALLVPREPLVPPVKKAKEALVGSLAALGLWAPQEKE